MFDFIKRLFGRKSDTSKALKDEESIEHLILKKRYQEALNELEFYRSLGIPAHEILDDGFDYYNHLKSKIEELREDNKALMNNLIRAQKEIKTMKELEKMYLLQIDNLQKENKLLQLTKSPIIVNDKEIENPYEEYDRSSNDTNTESKKPEEKKSLSLQQLKENLNQIKKNKHKTRFTGLYA